MKWITPVLLAMLLVAAACGSDAEDTDDAASEDVTDSEDQPATDDDTATEDEASDDEPVDETVTDDSVPEDEEPLEPDECVFASDDPPEVAVERPTEDPTMVEYDGDLAGAGEAPADLVEVATYGEGTTIAEDDGEPVVERLRTNPCTIFDDEEVYQCRTEGVVNNAVEAYVRLDQYLVWSETEQTLEVITFGENEFATADELATLINAENDNDDGFIFGPDFVLFANMGYGVFPADNPTSVGTYTAADANAGPNIRRENGRSDALIVIADSGYVASPPPFDFLATVSSNDNEKLPPTGSTSNPATAHGLMVAGIAGQRAMGTPISVVDVRDPKWKMPDPTGNGSKVELISVGSVSIRLTDEGPPGADLAILNMSFGTYGCTDSLFGEQSIEPFQKYVDQVLSQQYVVVASAGNNDTDEKQYPAAFDSVIGVGAIDDTVRGTSCDLPWKTATTSGCTIDQGTKPWFSNYGSWVEAWAPGTDVVTAYPEMLTYNYPKYDPGTMTSYVTMTATPGPLVRISGTSLAAPYVSAVLAGLEGATTDDVNAAVLAGDLASLGLDIQAPTMP